MEERASEEEVEGFSARVDDSVIDPISDGLRMAPLHTTKSQM